MLTPVSTRRGARTSGAIGSALVERPGEPSEDPAGASPAIFAETLRQTTLEAHAAIKRERRDLRVLRRLQFEIAALENQAARLELRNLRPFLDALRSRIEAALWAGGEP